MKRQPATTRTNREISIPRCLPTPRMLLRQVCTPNEKRHVVTASHIVPNNVGISGSDVTLSLLPGNYRKRPANTGVNTDGSTPSSAWISSHFERLNGEFRRRVKTQSALPSEDTAVVLLFSLVASGQARRPALVNRQPLCKQPPGPLSAVKRRFAESVRNCF